MLTMKRPDGKINKNIILVEITGEDVLYYDKHPEKLKRKQEDLKSSAEGHGWNGGLESIELTLQTACIYDIDTERYSDTSVYRNKKGNYIKKHGKRYYINDFKDESDNRILEIYTNCSKCNSRHWFKLEYFAEFKNAKRNFLCLKCHKSNKLPNGTELIDSKLIKKE